MTSVNLCKWRVNAHQASSEWLAISWENLSLSQIFASPGLRCVDEWMPLSWWTFSEHWQSFCWRACFEMASLTCAISNEVRTVWSCAISGRCWFSACNTTFIRCLRCRWSRPSQDRSTREGSSRSKISITQTITSSMILILKVHKWVWGWPHQQGAPESRAVHRGGAILQIIAL